MEQQRVIPAYIPHFLIFDPFTDDPLKQIELDFPFWIKPLLSYSGYLGFRIENKNDFIRHIQIIRDNIDRYARPYADLLQYANPDSSLPKCTAHHCIAEEIISSGRQCTVEGYAYQNHYMGGCLLGDNLSWASTMFARNSKPPDPEVIGERWRELWMQRLEGSGLWLEKWLHHQQRDE